MTVTLDIQRAAYGSLELRAADETARRFFATDISSVDPQHPSYDERARSDDKPTYNEADTTAIRRGMRLNRAPRKLWTWVREDAPVSRLADLPPSVDLIDASDADFAAVQGGLETALAGFIADRPGEWRRLAVATKIIHLQRPRLVPILDKNVLSVVGLHLPDDATRAVQVSMGLEAAALLRREGQRNRTALNKVEAALRADGRPRPKARILDALLWLAY